MENKTEITIPFDGFYNSISDYRVENRLFEEWCNENNKGYCDMSEIETDEKEYDDFNNWITDKKYRETKKRYINDYTDNFLNLIYGYTKINLDYTDLEMTSPREYNYGTDRLFIKVDFEKLKKLYEIVDKKILKETIKDSFTSYSGFSSHYSNDIDNKEWTDINDFDHNQWNAVFDAIVKQYDIQLCEF